MANNGKEWSTGENEWIAGVNKALIENHEKVVLKIRDARRIAQEGPKDADDFVWWRLRLLQALELD
jgi:hypothetical protein